MRKFNSASNPFVRLVSMLLVYLLVCSSGPSRTTSASSLKSGKKTRTRKAIPQRLSRATRIDGELLVRFSPKTTDTEITSLVEANGAHRASRLRGKSRVERLKVAVGHDQDAVMAGLLADPNVEFAEPNYIISQDNVTPNDSRFGEQWALHNSASSTAGINVAPAWQTTTGSWNTVIAVIDSGIDFSHPDLQKNQWLKTGNQMNRIVDDRDAYVGDINGWDWITNSNVITDSAGHGTAIAGIIAAEGNNGSGTTGVMWQAGLMSLRVLDAKGLGTVADAVEAIDYAAKHGAQVINCSWGTDGYSIALREAIKRAGLRGTIVVTSVGNNGQSIDDLPRYPASFDIPNLIAVAGSNSGGQLANWSNWGSASTTIAAPGDNILTTKMGGGYQAISGSSASAAFVSGVAGLIKTSRSTLGGRDIRDALTSQAKPVAAMTAKVRAGGIVNAADALARAKTVFTDDDPNAVKKADSNAVNANAAADSVPTPPGFKLPNLDVQKTLNPSQPKAPDPIHSTAVPLVNNQTEDDGGSESSLQAAVLETGQAKAWTLNSDPTFIATPDGADSTESRKIWEEITDSNGFASNLESMSNRANRSFLLLIASAPFYSTSDNFSEERLDPANRTGTGGEDLFSGNYSWGIPLVGLKGRAGLDLSVGLSYNSRVWTKSGSTIAFDADHGLPTPGFRLGFPVIEPVFTSSVTGVSTLLMVTSSGARAEFRLVDGSGHYEAVDSSYGQLTNNGDGTLTLRTAGGTKMTYTLHNSTGYDCTRIMDRNGNYITINYDSYRHISTIVDTLNRTITFNYDSNHNPTSITQTWGGSSTHTWATFGYTTLTINTNFTGLTLSGISNSTTINVLNQVGLADGSYSTFTYSSWGQVYTITNYAADAHELSHVTYNLPTSTGTGLTDCPRFTQRSDTVENWNSGSAVTTSFSVSTNAGWTKLDTTSDSGTLEQTTATDGTIYKTYSHSSGWDKGLPRLQETWSDSTHKQRWVYIDYTQDNTSVSYILNPRVTETNILDSSNRKRSTISYSNFTLPDGQVVYLPSDSYEYQSNATTVLRQSHTDYITDSTYLSWHILGLPSAQYLYEVSSAVFSHVGYFYDDSGMISARTAVQHDDTNYGTSFLTRGNADKIRRYDITNSSNYLETQVTYNTDGSVLTTTDPSSHVSTISYTDSFSDNTDHSTYAYPTTVTDADSNSSTIKYNYDFGGVTKTHNPKGAEMLTTYDSVGRVGCTTYHDSVNSVDGTATRYVYPTSQNIVQKYTLVQTPSSSIDVCGGTINSTYTAALTYSAQLADGAGRVVATVGDFLGSTGGYRGQYTAYDTMGRVSQTSNPIEMNSSWAAAGDDSTGGWVYTTQTYDWKGRPLVTTYPDSTTSVPVKKTFSYGGCGCAGGEIVTLTDEMGRQQRTTSDVIGRPFKTEILNSDASTYSTSIATFNVRDQATEVDNMIGTSGTSQATTMTYDNYGRLASQHNPIYDSGKNTSYTYNSDDTIATTTDPRGVVTTYSYNNRRQVTGISFDTSGTAYYQYAPYRNVSATPTISYAYDSAGNRTSMSDGTGSTAYVYDTWSHMTSETKTFGDLSTSYTVSYAYNLAGQLTSITTPQSQVIGYSYDNSGQLTGVTGSGFADSVLSGGSWTFPTISQFTSSMNYRAWGGLKGLTYGDTSSHALSISYNNRMRMTEFNIPSIMHATYQYNAAGQINYMHDATDNRFDRSYSYDQKGRLTTGLSGSEANGGSSSSWTGPYNRTYHYDEWDNMQVAHNRFWSNTVDNTISTYTNDRNTTLYGYDAEGNTITASSISDQYTFDAAGKQVSSYLITYPTQMAINQTYDGDGQSVYRDENYTDNNDSSNDYDIKTHYLRSTVLGGKIAVEFGLLNDTTDEGQTVYVYGGGELLAKTNYSASFPNVFWEHRNPASQSKAEIGGETNNIKTEFDPMMQETGLNDPYPYTSTPTFESISLDSNLFIEGGDPFDTSGGYEIDGMSVSAEEFNRQVEAGAVANGIDEHGMPKKNTVEHTSGGLYQRNDGTSDDPSRNHPEWLDWLQKRRPSPPAPPPPPPDYTPGTFGNVPNNIDDKLRKGFKNIKTKPGCMDWINQQLSKWAQDPNVKLRFTTADDLLENALFGYYNPFDSAWNDPNSVLVEDMGGWNNFQAIKSRLEPSILHGQATAYTPPGTNGFIFLTGDYFDRRIDPSRVLVHEMFHVAGIRTPKGGADPLDALDAEIYKNCGNGDPLQH